MSQSAMSIVLRPRITAPFLPRERVVRNILSHNRSVSKGSDPITRGFRVSFTAATTTEPPMV